MAKKEGDPFCKSGLADTSLTTCCQGDCNECSDVSDTCKAKDENGRGSTCCPKEILAADVLALAEEKLQSSTKRSG